MTLTSSLRLATSLTVVALTTVFRSIAADLPVELDADRHPKLVTHGDCLIRGGTLLTVSHGSLRGADILVRGGKIVAIGPKLDAPSGVAVIDATGKFVTPGIVDSHSHIALDAVNEGTDSITPEVDVRDAIDPRSVSIYRGLSSGVTTSLLLHGSANAIGGQSVVVKMKWDRPVDELIVPDAPRMVKFALGENVKQSNRFPGMDGGRFPSTRPGVEAVYRRAFAAARAYMAKWDTYEKLRATRPNTVAPRKDLRLEALSDILRRRIWVQCHSYRADEMLMLVRLSQEFGFKLATLHHALEAYKIAPEIAKAGVGVSTFSADWAYKIEAYDAIPYNAALCMRAGIVTSVDSDNEEGTYHLNLEAARCMRYGDLNETEALKLITINPAIQLGVDRRVGTLDVGKDGDIAIWSGHPLSVFSRCETTLVEGEVFFQRRDSFGLDAAATIHADFTHSGIDPLAVPAPRASSTYALVGGTVYPISGPDIGNGTVVIREGKILAVGAHVAIPSGALSINVRGLNVYPGLIDAGTPLGLTEIGSINATNDTDEGGKFQPDLRALTAVNPASELIPVARVAGITSARIGLGGRGDFGPGSLLVAGQGAVIALTGSTTETMGIANQTGLTVGFPESMSAETIEFLTEFLPPEDLQKRRDAEKEAPKALREYFDKAKQYAAERAAAPDQVPFEPRLEAMIPYITGKQPVYVVAGTVKAIKDAVKFADDYKLKMILVGGNDAWRAADLLASKHVPVIYGVPISDSLGGAHLNDYDPYDAGFAGVAVLLKAGVKVGFSSESASEARNLPGQVGMLCAFGVPHDSALRCLTLGNAEIIGTDAQTGSLDPGKRADIIVTDGDPLEISTRVVREFIGGQPLSLETRHTRLYEKYRGLTPPTSSRPHTAARTP